MHDSDALEFADDDNDDAPGDGELDLLWVDFGDGDALDEFFDKAGDRRPPRPSSSSVENTDKCRSSRLVSEPLFFCVEPPVFRSRQG